ncbi:hypothetical protein NDU88_004998 [Pleurodeles waltl]|uniref:Uncharacterized protein n=1 Tax=Pleurodeles waltl TaxID=8319 RepID=A0AAV7QH38_PLEWA|nr:hypothetical protein NDU88_004998 [Pleurodeles waltl]
MLLAVSVTVYLVIVIVFLLFQSVSQKYKERSHLPPGPRPLPFIGNLHQLNTSGIVASLKAFSEKYGPVYTVHLGLRQVVILCGYDAVKEALVDQAEQFSGRGPTPTLGMVLKDHGIILSNGSRWKELRQFTFLTFRNLGLGNKGIEGRIQEEAFYLIEELRHIKGLTFNPTIHISSAVSNVICSVIFGNRFDYQDEEFVELLRLLNEAIVISSSFWGQLYNMYSDIMDYLPGPHQRIYSCFTHLERFVERRVKINQESLNRSAPRDFIDSFLIKMEMEKQNPSTEYFMKNLVITVLDLFIAGTETVSTTIRFGLLLLLKYPDIQEKVQEEIDRVIGRNSIVSFEDRIKMPFTDAVINEIQRYCNLAPLGLPHMVVQDTKFREFLLPKGTEVWAVLASVLHDPSHFTDPENFNPMHFFDETGKIKKNDAFIPFSAGIYYPNKISQIPQDMLWFKGTDV